MYIWKYDTAHLILPLKLFPGPGGGTSEVLADYNSKSGSNSVEEPDKDIKEESAESYNDSNEKRGAKIDESVVLK